MATSLIAILGKVPWGTVMEALPTVVDGASRLIGRNRDGAAALEAVDARTDPALPPAVARHLERIEQTVVDLAEQQAEASELIRTLAAGNAAMVERIALLQRGLIAVAILAIAALAVALAG